MRTDGTQLAKSHERTRPGKSNPSFDIGIGTFEAGHYHLRRNLNNSSDDPREKLCAVVVDELHMIQVKDNRGLEVETLLSLLRYRQKQARLAQLASALVDSQGRDTQSCKSGLLPYSSACDAHIPPHHPQPSWQLTTSRKARTPTVVMAVGWAQPARRTG